MALATDLPLPTFDYTDPSMRGERFHEVMREVASESWLATSPLGWLFVLEAEAAAFFLRTRAAGFPSMTVAEVFGITDGPLYDAMRKNLITIEGDDHRRLRNLVNPAFTARATDRFRPAMREHLEAIWAKVVEAGHCEFVGDVAKRYPAMTIATVVGAPVEDADRLHEWATWFQRQFDAATILENRQRIERAIVEFQAYAQELIARRRDDPADDLVSALLTAVHEGDRLSDDECINLVMNVLAGGVDTTQAQLAHALRLFAGRPDQWALLAREPARVPAAVEEALRFEPITPFTARMTIEDVEYRGVKIPAGTVLMISLFSANRDADAFTAPHAFDITADRGRSKPMTFGAGIHNCLGANLARAELQEAFAFLAPRMRDLRLDGEPRYDTISGVYGLDELPLRFTALEPATEAPLPS